MLAVRRLLLVLGATASLVLEPAGRPAPAVESPTAEHRGACGTGSWVAGTTELCDGVLVYRDYVFDDHGADTGVPYTEVCDGCYYPATGDQRYPGPLNVADLVGLRLWVEGDRLRATFELGALFTSNSTVAALAIDTDDNRATGGGAWGDLGVTSLGWDRLEILRTGDPDSNRIEGSLPLPPGDRWRLQAVTGVAAGPVMNVAFRGPDETGYWWEDKQAAVLRSRDISGFGFIVEKADLVDRATRRAAVGPGIHQRVYESEVTLPPGEGVSYQGVPGRLTGAGHLGQRFHFVGRYQPYGVYLPESSGPHGLQVLLHGLGEGHSARLFLFPGTPTRAVQRLGEDRNRILVVPLARGPAGFYTDAAERDVLDVLGDVQASYQVDPDLVFLGGLSMGGYGTYRLAGLYPDRFAGFVTWVGYTGDCLNGTPLAGNCRSSAIGNAVDLMGNLRNVPGAMLYAGADHLVPVTTALAVAERFRQMGSPYIWYLHPAAGHETLVFTDDWSKESAWTAGLRRTARPRQVTFRTDPALGNPAMGLVHDRAYWLSGIRPRAPGWADLDLTGGCGPVIRTEAGRGAGPDPVPWISESAEVTSTAAAPAASALEGTVSNVATVTVDPAGACLGDGPFPYRLTTDGPVTVLFADGRSLALAAAGTHEGTVPPTGWS